MAGAEWREVVLFLVDDVGMKKKERRGTKGKVIGSTWRVGIGDGVFLSGYKNANFLSDWKRLAAGESELGSGRGDLFFF